MNGRVFPALAGILVVMLGAREAGAQPVHALLFDADPFAARAAVVLGAVAVPDWTSDASAAAGEWSVMTERFDAVAGLLPVGRVTVAPVPAGTAFVLPNQLASDVSVFAGRGLGAAFRDADGNGLDDAWEQRFFGRVGVDPEADPDGDGYSNRAEHDAGTDPTDAASRPALSDLIARWSGEGDARDVFAGRDGAWLGEAGFAAGRDGLAFDFGGEQAVRVPDQAVFREVTSLSIAAWVRCGRLDGNGLPVLVRPSSLAGIPGFGLELGSQGPRLRLSAAAGTRSDGPALEIVPGTWYHLVGVWAGTEVRVYVNGELASKDRINAGFGPLDLPEGRDLFLGSDGGTRHFVGQVDEVVLAGRALTDAEIRSLANPSAGEWRVEVEVVPGAAGDGAQLRIALPALGDAVVLEGVDALGGVWGVAPARAVEAGGRRYLEIPIDSGTPARFFRLRR